MFENGNDVFLFVSAYRFVVGILEHSPMGLIYTRQHNPITFSSSSTIMQRWERER